MEGSGRVVAVVEVEVAGMEVVGRKDLGAMRCTAVAVDTCPATKRAARTAVVRAHCNTVAAVAVVAAAADSYIHKAVVAAARTTASWVPAHTLVVPSAAADTATAVVVANPAAVAAAKRLGTEVEVGNRRSGPRHC